MMERLQQSLDKLNPTLVTGMMVFIVALLAFEGWMLALRKPFAEYQQVAASEASLKASLSQAPDQASELGRLAAELRQLSDNLSGQLHLPAADDKIAASLMEALDRSAAKYNVRLSGVKPRERRPVSVFEEVSFEVSAQGSYLPLCEWMLDFNNTLGNNVTLSDFDMKVAEEGRKVQATVRLALYRPQMQGGVTK